MRTLALFFGLALLLGLGSCSKEHGDLIADFPAMPEITGARLAGAEADSVYLSWTYAGARAVDEYRIYVGVRVNYGYGIFDTLGFWAATGEQNFAYQDPGLASVDPDLCEQFGVCDSAYKYAYFRVSAVVGGEEGIPGWRTSPAW